MGKHIGPRYSEEYWDRAVPLPRRSPTCGAPVDPSILQQLDARRNFGFESREDAARRLAWRRRKALLLKWVERQMGRILKPTERQSIRLVYFEGLSQRQAAIKMNKNNGTVSRAIVNAIDKLRAAAREQGVSWGNPLVPDDDDNPADKAHDEIQ